MAKTLKQQCDELWAEKVKERAGGKCEYCGKSGFLAAHHIIPRTCYGSRYDLENGVALCHPRHHIYWAHKDTIEFYNWVNTVRNIEYLESIRHRQSKNDYQLIKLSLEK